MNHEIYIVSENYNNITDDQFSQLLVKGASNAIVSFTTEWSSECHLLNNLNNEISDHEEDITFFQVDKEKHFRYYNTYKLNRVPTTLFLANGSIIHHMVGCPPHDQYLNAIKSFYRIETI